MYISKKQNLSWMYPLQPSFSSVYSDFINAAFNVNTLIILTKPKLTIISLSVLFWFVFCLFIYLFFFSSVSFLSVSLKRMYSLPLFTGQICELMTWWAEYGHITAPLLSLIFTIGVITHSGFGKNSALIILFLVPTIIWSSKIMDIDGIYRCLKVWCGSTNLKIHQLCVITLALTFPESIFKNGVWTSAERSHHFFPFKCFFPFPQECEWGFTHLPDFFVSDIIKGGNQVTKHSFFSPVSSL